MGFFDSKEKEGKLPESYTVTLYCKNCEATADIEIPFGTTVADFAKTFGVCKNCGCNTGFELDADLGLGDD